MSAQKSTAVVPRMLSRIMGLASFDSRTFVSLQKPPPQAIQEPLTSWEWVDDVEDPLDREDFVAAFEVFLRFGFGTPEVERVGGVGSPGARSGVAEAAGEVLLVGGVGSTVGAAVLDVLWTPPRARKAKIRLLTMVVSSMRRLPGTSEAHSSVISGYISVGEKSRSRALRRAASLEESSLRLFLCCMLRCELGRTQEG